MANLRLALCLTGPPAADWPRDRWALLFAQPSQDLWALNLNSGVATEIQDGRGPQTASMRWDGTSDKDVIIALFPKASGGNIRGGGLQFHRNNPVTGADFGRGGISKRDGSAIGTLAPGGRSAVPGTQLDDLTKSRALAGVIGDNVPPDPNNPLKGKAFLWTDTNLWEIARDDTTNGLEIHTPGNAATHVGTPHNLNNVQAAVYWPVTNQFIVYAGGELLFFDPFDMSTSPVGYYAPPNIRSLFVHPHPLGLNRIGGTPIADASRPQDYSVSATNQADYVLYGITDTELVMFYGETSNQSVSVSQSEQISQLSSNDMFIILKGGADTVRGSYAEAKALPDDTQTHRDEKTSALQRAVSSRSFTSLQTVTQSRSTSDIERISRDAVGEAIGGSAGRTSDNVTVAYANNLITVNGISNEKIQDIAGALLSPNNNASYNDADGMIDLVNTPEFEQATAASMLSHNAEISFNSTTNEFTILPAAGITPAARRFNFTKIGTGATGFSGSTAAPNAAPLSNDVELTRNTSALRVVNTGMYSFRLYVHFAGNRSQPYTLIRSAIAHATVTNRRQLSDRRYRVYIAGSYNDLEDTRENYYMDLCSGVIRLTAGEDLGVNIQNELYSSAFPWTGYLEIVRFS